MNLLALETTTEHCSVALAAGGRVLVRERIAPREHGSLLVPWIRELLEEAGLDFQALDALAVGRGPGGFTSLRLGLSVAQGIGLAQGLPVHPVSSLAALALAGRPAGFEGPVLACLDARMGEVYAGLFRFSGGRPESAGPESVGPPGALDLPGSEPVWGLGSGFSAHGQALAERLAGRLAGFSPDAWPGARAVAALARSAGPVEAAWLRPVYLRDRVAEPPV